MDSDVIIDIFNIRTIILEEICHDLLAEVV